MKDSANILTQEEVDNLVNNKGQIAFIDTSHIKNSGNRKEVMNRYKEVLTAEKRLEWARANLSYDEIVEYRRYLHYAAFSLWLANRQITAHDFKSLIQKEIKKKQTL